MQASHLLNIFLDTHVGVCRHQFPFQYWFSIFARNVDSLYTLYLSVAPIHNNCRFKFYLGHHNPRLTNYSQISCSAIPEKSAVWDTAFPSLKQPDICCLLISQTSEWPERNAQNLLFLWNSPYDSAHAHYIQDYDFQVMHRSWRTAWVSLGHHCHSGCIYSSLM
jgi:hypothetical protein